MCRSMEMRSISRRSTRVPRVPRQLLFLRRAMLRLMGQTMFRPVAASSVALSSHCPRLLVRGADSGKYGGSWKGCISPRRKRLHVVVEDGWRSARFRPSATNQHLSKPPRVSPEPKRRRDNLLSQTMGSSILRRDDCGPGERKSFLSVWRCLSP